MCNCFIIHNKTVKVKNTAPYYGQITIDLIKKFIETDKAVIDEELIQELAAYLAADEQGGFELAENVSEISDIIRFLGAAFKNKYNFTTKRGAARVIPVIKEKLSTDETKKIIEEFLDSLKNTSLHPEDVEVETLSAELARQYSRTYKSVIIKNFKIAGS